MQNKLIINCGMQCSIVLPTITSQAKAKTTLSRSVILKEPVICSFLKMPFIVVVYGIATEIH